MRKCSRARLFSTCLTGAILAAAAPAWAQTSETPTWKPRAEVDAQVGKDIGVSTSLFAPLAQNDSSLVYVDGRIGYDQRYDRNGSATIGARVRVGDDAAIGVSAGADFYRSDIGARDQAAVSLGLEGFTSVFDVRLNYRLPVSKTRTIGFIDPAASGSGALVLENNRLIERYSGFRLEAIPLQGFNGEAGVRLPVGDNASIRASAGGFDYWDKDADRNYRGVRGGLEMDVEDRDSGARFTFGGTVEHDNRYGTDARATVRLSIPFGPRASDRGSTPTGLDRQMGDRVRRDYVARSGSRFTDLTTSRFAIDARTGNVFGGFYYANGTGVTGAAGTLASPTSIADAVSRAGANGVVVALGNGGNITTPGVTLAANQYLVGGASTVDVRLINGSTTAYALGGTNGVVVGTSAAGAAVTLGQGSVVRDVTVRGAGTGIAAAGVGGFALDRVTIENTGGAGLSLTNTLGAVSLTGLTIRGGAGAGVLINGGSSVALANSTISGGAGAVDINDGGAELAVALSNLTLSATGGNVLDIDGSGTGGVTVTGMSGITIRGGTGETGGLSVRSATFDASTTTAGIQTVNAGRMEIGTTGARVNGQGAFFTDVTGSLSFADLDIANSGGTGLHVVNSKVNSFTLATLDGTIDTVGGTAMDLDPLVINLNFTGISSVGAGGAGLILDTVQGGGTGGNALTIGTLTISNSGGDALVILNSTGLVRVGGGTIANSGGSAVRIGEAGVAGSGGSVGLVFAGSITDPAGTSPIVAIFNASGTISFTGPIAGSGGILVQDTLAGSAISFGAITLTGTVGPAISLNGLAGSINFAGLVTIANPGAAGIVIGDVPGVVTFGDVDITGLGAFTGLDVRGAHGNVLFNTLDISGTGTGTGIDVTGSTNAGNVIILNASTIQGVQIGVDLTRASMTGQFRFGDGDAGTLDSTISATIPIVIELMDGSHGSYNFADARLVGDTSNLTGAGFTAYYAQVGATGTGTRSDPGSLAGADASSAQYIVLLNDPAGGQDVFDAASAGGSFDLAAGQSLVSFLAGDFIAVSGAGMPPNLIVSGVGPSGITNVYAGSGAAVLTSTLAGSATVNLASNSSIEGLIIRNAAGDVGVEGSGVSNVRIANSNISGVVGAVAIRDGGATSSVQLTHLDLASAAGTTLALSGAGAGTLTVSAADVDIAATGTSTALSLLDVTSGGISFGSVSTGVADSTAVTVRNVVGGSVGFDSVAVGGTTLGNGLAVGDNSSALSFGSISVSGANADAAEFWNNSSAITIGAISASASGDDAVVLNGNRAVTIGTLAVGGAGGSGLSVLDSLGAVSIGGGAISGASNGVWISGVAGGVDVSIGGIGISGTLGSGIAIEDVDGSVHFTGTTAISGVGTAGIAFYAGSTGTIAFGDVDITGLGANRSGVDARAASGTISFNTLDIAGSSTTGTRGIDLTGANFATSFTTAESGSISGVGVGVDLTNAAITGSFRYGDGSNTDADGAASTISAVTPILITGLNAGVGSYNFLDVALTGDTSALTTSATLYFVKAGATGIGTLADPGSLAGAEAAAANTVILLNDPAGGQDLLDAAGAGGSLNLDAGQALLSFLGGDTLLLPGGAPANLLLFGVAPGQVTNPYAGSGAPILTTSVAAANTVTLGGGNTIQGVVVQTGAGGGVGIYGSGVANIAIRDSNISGQAGAIRLLDGGVAANVALANLRLGSAGGTVLELDGSGGGSLAVTALGAITIEGGNGETGGLIATDILFDADLSTAGTQTVSGTLIVGTAGARVDGVGVSITGDGSLDLASLNVFNANDVGVELIGGGALTAIVQSGTIDTLGNDALSGQNAALTLAFGSITATDGGIFMIANAAATSGEPVLNVARLNLTDGGLILSGSGDYVFANASITDNVGVAVLLGGAVNLDYAGDITSGIGASATIVTFGHTGTASFHDGTIDVTDGDGFQFLGADGTYSFTGTATLHGGDAGINVASGSSGTFSFGAGTSVTNGAVANFVLQDSDANVTYLGSLSQGLNTDNFVVSNQSGGVLDFSQAAISASAGTGLLFLGADGTTTLGDVQLSGGAGIAVAGSAGTLGFGNIDITGVAANQIAVDLTGATGNVTFQTLDIAGTSASGSKGIDLSGSTTAANIIITESSSITGVGIGVDLTNAAITGSFRFGDGSSTDADGAASTISASVPIEIAGLNGGVGSYNFADVNLIGDTSRLVTSATTYFVAAGASGAGTMADPGNLAGAEASGAQIIILLNDPAGGQDVLDAVDAGGSFDLLAGQSLLGFLNGDTLTLPAGGPANLILFGLTPGQIVNPFTGSGAPILTHSGAGNTINLASNNLLDGIIVAASNGPGIVGTGTANVTIRNSVVSGSSGAIVLSDGGASASAWLSNLQLSASGGTVLNLDGGGAGTLTITGLDDIVIAGGNGETAGLLATAVIFDADLAAAGYQAVTGTLQIGTTAARIGGNGVYLDQAEGATDFTLDIATDAGTGLYATGGAGGLRLGIAGGTIDTTNAGALDYGLILQDLSSSVTLASLSYSGTATGVWTQNVTGVGAGGSALDIDTLTVADGAAEAISMTGSATGGFRFGAGSAIGTTTNPAAITLSNTGASSFTYAGSINYAGANAVLSVSGGHSGTVTFTGTIDATSGTGLVFDNADGTYNFTGSASLAAGIAIANGSAGSFTIANMAITNPAGSALDIRDSTASLSYSGDITYFGAVTPAIYIANHSGGTIAFGAGSLTTTGGNGLTFVNADGTYTFANTIDVDANITGIAISGGSSGSFDFGAAVSVVTTGGSAISVAGSSASLDYRGHVGATGGFGVSIIDHVGGAIDLSSATMSLDGAELRFDNADASYDFGSFSATGGARIAFLNGSAGSFTFGDVDLAGIGTNQTAVDLTGATGDVTFQTLDITGTSTTGSKGIDLTGSTTAANIIVNESSSITGVGTGVDLTNAAITGTFRYGDGSSTDADGAASVINAVTPIAIGGLNPGVGTYDFADVVLTGDTSGLQTNKTVYWVQAGAVGTGTRSDPGSLAGAEASGADVIILLDTQGVGKDVLDAATAGGSLDLIADQSLLSFLNGDTLSVGGGAPANLLLFGLAGGTVTNPYAGSGAPLLTTSLAGANTVNLASGAVVDGVQIGNLSGRGVYGGYLTAVTVRNSVIFGGVDAIEIVANGGSAALSNLDLSSATGDVLRLRGDGGNLVVRQLDDLTILGANTGRGLFGELLVFDADLATPGIQTVVGAVDIGSSASRVGGGGLVLDDVTGALTLATNVFNTDGDGISAAGGAGGFTLAITGGAIDTGVATTGSALNLSDLSADIDLSSITYAGLASGVTVSDVTGVGAGSTALNVGALTVASGAARGILVSGTTSGNFDFGSASSIVGTTAAGIELANSGAGNFDYRGNITGVTAGALVLASSGDIGAATFSGTLSATGGTGLRFDNADGTYNFSGTATLNGGDAGIDVLNGSSGSFTFGAGTSVTSPSGIGIQIQASDASLTYLGSLTYATAGQAALSVTDHAAGLISFTGATLNVTNGTGLQFSNADGSYDFDSVTLNGGDAGIDIFGGSSGGFTFGTGASIISPSGVGIDIAGSTATVTYSGSLTYATAGQAAIRIADHSGGTITFQTGTLDITDGTGLQFDNADGTYDFTGTATLNGGDAGIDVLNSSGGSFTFGTGTSITSPSGVGINISGSTAAVTYSGSLTYATAGQAAVNVLNHSGGTITFQTGTLNITDGTGLQFDNADGTYDFTGTSTLNGGDAGIDVLNGSGGSFTFGTGTSITSPSGTGINVEDSTASVTYSGSLTYATAAQAAVNVLNHSGGTITFQTGTLNITDGTGLQFDNADGTYAFNGTTTLNGGNAHLDIQNGSDGVFGFGTGASIVSPTSAAAIRIDGSDGDLTYLGSLTQAGPGALVAVANHNGTLTFGSGALVATNGTGLQFTSADGTYAFGAVTLGGGARIALSGSGTFTFGDVDITGLLANQTGADLTSALGDVTFATLDISGASASGTRGIDLTGNSGTGDIVVTNSSAISGVGVGVDLTNANRTGLFQYGDGESAIDVASSISATTPIVITGLNGGTGTYNFADVALTGDTSGLATSATVFYVLAGASGAGTLSDPGSLAAAEAATADFIILLNDPNGGQDVITAAGSNGNGTLVLDVDQALRSFRDSNTILLPGGAPANVILTGVMTGQVTNPFAASAPTATDRAPILTTSGAFDTVTLSNGSSIDGVFIQGVSGQSGIYGIGRSGVVISNASLSGAGVGLRLDGGGSASATLTNLDITSTDGGAWFNLAGSGPLTLTGSDINIATSGSASLLTLNQTTIGAAGLQFGTLSGTGANAAVTVTQNGGTGTLAIDTITLSGTGVGDGVTLDGNSGDIELGAVTIAGRAGSALSLANGGNVEIDSLTVSNGGRGLNIVNGAAGIYSVDSLSLSDVDFGIYQSSTFTGSLTIGTATITDADTGMFLNGSNGTVTFTGDVSILNPVLAGIQFGGGATTYTFDDVDITDVQANGRGVDARSVGGGNVYFETLDITGASVTGTRGIDLTGNTGTGAFIVNESSSITGVGIGVDLTNASRISTFRYGDGSNIDADLAASTINATTPIVIAGLNGGTGTYDFRDVTLIGDTSPLEVSAFFVRAGATGIGSRSDPGSLAAADSSTASFIVLLDSQAGAGAFDTLTGTLSLADDQSLLSFRDVDSFNVGGGAPPNVFVFNITTGTITNPNSGSGAPLLTSTDATGTVTLGGSSTIDGVVISNTGTGAGVYANGTAGTATIRNSTISGGGAGIDIRSGATARIVNLQNLTLRNAGGNAGALLNLNGTGGTLTVTGMANLSINTAGAETAGLVFNTVTFDSDLASGGIQAVNAGALTLGTSGARVQGDGLSLTNVSGALTFTDIDIANNGGTGLLVANSKVNNFLLTTLDGSVDTTNGTSVNLDPLAVNITLASVSASGGAYGILLDQVDGSFTVTGAVSVTGATTAGIAIQDNTAQATPLAASFNGAVSINNTSGAGLSLTNNAGATISFAGAGTGVDLVTTSGAGLVASGGGTISFAGSGNTIQTATGQVLSIADVTAAAGGVAFASLTSTGIVAGATAINVDNLDGGAFSGGTVSIAGTSGAASDGLFIGGGSSSAVSFGATTIADTGDEGIEIGDTGNGAISFANVTINGATGDGVLVRGSDGAVTISGGEIGNLDDPTGSGVYVNGGSGTVTIDANIHKTSAGRAVLVGVRTGGDVAFGGTIASSGAATGLSVTANSGGTITFSGASKTIGATGAAGVELLNNTGTTINFTNGGLAITSDTSGLSATGGGTLNIAGAGNTISATGNEAMLVNGMTVGASGINFASISTSSIGTGTGIALTNVGSAGGAIALGTVNLQGIATRGVDITGTLGAALSFADLDISLANASAVAFDLNGATLSAAVTANDFDVTNAAVAGTSIAVDLRDTTGGQVIRLGDGIAGGASATIAGVATGVWLNAASNATFTYGDGESATDGTSTISAGTGINAAAAPGSGSYNFRDVTFGASPGLGFGVGRTWFVDSNGAVGGGNGSGADGGNPMSLAAAELALAATDVIVLVNNGGAISTAGSNGNDTLALLANTQVRGFGQGPLALTLTVPATILLSSNTINIADPTGNGAATLTSAAGADVITLGASGNRISGFILDGAPGGALRGIVDNGGATGTVVNFMTIRNFNAVGGYGAEITPSTNSTIDNVSFTGNTNDIFLNAAGSTISNVTAIGATGTAITLNNATGTTTLTNVNISGAVTGLSFTTPAGTINATNVDIAGAATSALTVSGGTASFNFDASSSIIQATGGIAVNFTGNHTTGTFAFAGLINATSGAGLQFNNADGTYNFIGTTTLNGGDAGIDIYNGATGTFAFGSGTTLTHNGAGNALSLLSSATLTYDGTITDNDGIAVEIDNHDAGTATFNGAISSSSANTSTVVSVANSNAGSIVFNGQMNIASSGPSAVVNVSNNDGGTITFNAGGTGLDITSGAGTGMLISGGGTVNVLGSGNSITTTSGTLLSITNTGATTTTANLDFASASNTSGANGIFVQRAAGTLDGTVTIGGGAITATARGISLSGDAISLSYGGMVTTSGGAARSFEATNRIGGVATLSGNLTDTSLGINIANNSGGTINFTGQTIGLTTGANTAVTLSSNTGTTVNFASAAGGNGLDILTTTGTGFSATGGGTVIVAGTGNSIQTGTGQVLNLSGVSAGAGGINWGSLQATGVVAAIAVNFNNFDSAGGAFSGGTTSIAGTSGGSDAIFIGNGSAANVTFGATTIGTGANVVSGDGIEVNGSGNGVMTFASVDIDNTTAHGVSIIGAAGATGAVTINGGTIGAGGAGSITGDGVNITGGGGSATIAASIAKTNAGNVVEVSNHAAGTVTLSGNLSATGGAANGILLNNNSGGTIIFSGASKTLSTGANNAVQFDNSAGTGAAVSFTGGNLDVDTTSGRGITATSTNAGAGSLTIQGTNNTIVSVGGIALNLVNTNIAAGGLNFLSVSANSGSRGILLNTTGGAGGLTITGTGATDGSGGTIQNITARGIELLNTALVSISNLNLTSASTTGQAAGQDLDLTTANGAIYMSGVATAVFDNINITGTIADNGITGINVSNFQLNNSLITGAGDGANESGIEFSNLSGTSSLTNTEIALSETNSLDIVNTDVNLNLTLNNVIFRDTQSNPIGEGGFQFRSFSNAAGTPTTNIDILDSDFLRIRTQAMQIIAEDDSVLSVDITNNVIDSGTGIGTGIDINGNDTSTVRFNVIGNPTIRSSGGSAVNITSFINANVMGRIANNANISNYNNANTAVTGAYGSNVRVLAQENSHLTVAVTGNTMSQGAGNNSSAFDGIAREGSARLDVTFTGNTISQLDSATLAAINFQSGSSSASNIETNQIYANIANNNVTVVSPANLLRLRVSELDNTHDPRIFLQGFVDGGAGIEDDAVATWNANGNTPTATTSNVAVSLSGTATGPSAGTAQTPTNPLP